MWSENSIKKILLSSIFIVFKSVVFYDNNITDTSLISSAERNLMLDKINLDISTVIDINNQLYLSLYTLDKNISDYVFKKTLTEKNLNPDFTVTDSPDFFSHFTDNLIVHIYDIINRNSKIQFDYKRNIFNTLFKEGAVANELTRNYFLANENSMKTYRLFSEKLSYLMDESLKTFANSGRDLRIYICAIPFILCIVVFSIFCIILSKVNLYKIQIVNIFFLIEKKYGDDVVKKCEGFLEKLDKFLKNKKNEKEGGDKALDDENNPRLSNIKQHEQEDGIGQHSSPHPKPQSSKKNNKHHDKEKSKKPDEQAVAEEDEDLKNDNIITETKFRKNMCPIYAKISVLIILIMIYFIVTIVLNYSFSKELQENTSDLSMIAERGSCLNNLMIYTREMLIYGKKSNLKDGNFTNFTRLYDEEVDLSMYDLFSIYLAKSQQIRLKIPQMTDNTIISAFRKSENDFNVNDVMFCEKLKNAANSTYFYIFQKQCTGSSTFFRQKGLQDNIGFILSDFNFIALHLSNQETNTFEEVIANLKDPKNNLKSYIENTIFYIDAAIIIEINDLKQSLEEFFTNNINISIIKISLYILILLIDLISFLYIGKYLNKMLNKDKSILEIIPNDVLMNSENVQEALKTLNGIA